jgi:hypothetical protein
MNPALSTLDKFEVLDGVRHVRIIPRDSRFVQSPVQ